MARLCCIVFPIPLSVSEDCFADTVFRASCPCKNNLWSSVFHVGTATLLGLGKLLAWGCKRDTTVRDCWHQREINPSGGLTLTPSAGSACSAALGEGDQQKTELKCEIGLGGKAPDLLHCGDKWGIKLGPYLSVHKCKGELLFRNKGMLWPAPAEVLLCLLIGLLKCYRAQKW